MITSVEQKEKSKGNEEQAKFVLEYRKKVEGELVKMCNTILLVLDGNLIPKASNGESKVFYQQMKGDFYHYIAKINTAEKRRRNTSALIELITPALKKFI